MCHSVKWKKYVPMATSLGSGVGGGLVTKLCPTLATPWTVACQASLSMGFLGKNTGVGCHFLLQMGLVGHIYLFFYIFSHPSN